MSFWGTLTGSNEKEQQYKELKEVCSRYTNNQEQLKSMAVKLYDSRKDYMEYIYDINDKLKLIENLPNWCVSDMEDSLRRMNDFKFAVKCEKNPQQFAQMTDKTGRTSTYVGNNTASGSAIASLGPKTSMSIATVIGTGSTGTTNFVSSGTDATNAALVWLGGGIVAAGGIIAAGALMLGFVGAAAGVFTLRFKTKEQIEKINGQIDEIRHDNQNIEPKLRHLSALITRSYSNEINKLKPMLKWITNVAPKNYNKWNDDQKHKLEELMNVVSNTVQLINERI